MVNISSLNSTGKQAIYSYCKIQQKIFELQSFRNQHQMWGGLIFVDNLRESVLDHEIEMGQVKHAIKDKNIF